MTLTPETLYLQLGGLIRDMPDFESGPVTLEMNRWLGRLTALVQSMGDHVDIATLKVSAQMLNGITRAGHAQTIAAVAHRSFAKAELEAPAATQGTFIVAGSVFEAFAAVSKVMEQASANLLLVDAYADAVVLKDFALLAPEAVKVRLLAKVDRKALLQPAIQRWATQFGATRPLEVRLADPMGVLLHDRLIVVDGKTVWDIGQSFNGLAKRAHTTLARTPAEIAAEKIAAYEAIWTGATPLA